MTAHRATPWPTDRPRDLLAPLFDPIRFASDLRLDIFAGIFALATLNHVIEYVLELQEFGPFAQHMEMWTRVKISVGWPSALVIALLAGCFVLSLLILALPWRQTLLSLLAIPYLLTQLASPEHTGSHNSVMTGALGLLLLLGVAELVERVGDRRSGAPAGTDWVSWRRIGLRSVCTLTYLFAAFHKLNTSFFSPVTSPAVPFVLPLTRLLDPFSQTPGLMIKYAAIFGTVAIEASLPILLLYGRTRPFAWILGLLFHLPMLVYGVTEFTLLIVAFYPLFATAAEARELALRCVRRPHVPRLVITFLVGLAISALSLNGFRTRRFHAVGPDLDPIVLLTHDVLLILSIFLWVHVTITVAAWLVDRRLFRSWPVASGDHDRDGGRADTRESRRPVPSRPAPLPT